MNSRTPFLGIIIVTYLRDLHLNTLLSALSVQTCQDFEVLVIHDGPSTSARTIVNRYEVELQGRLRYFETEQRFNDYGHSLRRIGLDMMSTQFILLTNDDNYYVPVFVEEVKKTATSKNTDLILLDAIHSYPDIYTSRISQLYIRVLDKMKKHGIKIIRGRKSSYSVLRSKPLRNCVDIGSIVCKTELAKKVGFESNAYDADGIFCEKLVIGLEKEKIANIKKILFVHN